MEVLSYPHAATCRRTSSSGVDQQCARGLRSVHWGRSVTESSLLLTAGVGQPLDAAGVGAGLCRQALRRVRLPHGAACFRLPYCPVQSAQSALHLLAKVPSVCEQQRQRQRQRQLQGLSRMLNMHWCFCRCGGAEGGMTATGSRTGCCATGCRPSMLVHRQIDDCQTVLRQRLGSQRSTQQPFPAVQEGIQQTRSLQSRPFVHRAFSGSNTAEQCSCYDPWTLYHFHVHQCQFLPVY